MQSIFSPKKTLCVFILLALSCVTASVNARVIPYQGDAKSTVASTTIKSSKEDPAITRTRQQIKMLDDLYKTAVVLITEHYVTDPSILSAASAAKALFAAMKKKWLA